MKVLYDPLTKTVTDRQGHELRFIPPPGEQIVELFKNQVARTDPPVWYRDERRVITLKADPEVNFDEERLVWFNCKTGKIFAGFSPPLTDQVTYDIVTIGSS